MAIQTTGVENHGGLLRIWFMYKGKRFREVLGVPDTPKNRRMAAELRSSIVYGIKTGNFNYAAQFPQSKNLAKLGIVQKSITLQELADKWLDLKEMEIAKNTITLYRSYIAVCVGIMGANRLVASVDHEMALDLRKELLTGYQIVIRGQNPKRVKKGRAVRTVNGYLSCLAAMFNFAEKNCYIEKSPFSGISPLKKSRAEPDPLTKDEYLRLVHASPSLQIKNIWQLAISTGLRHGELGALAWEDIDTKEWTAKITRNIAVSGHFTPPKTESSIRVIKLNDSAIEALQSQMALTKMRSPISVKVHLREYGKTRTDECTFVFSPKVSAKNKAAGDWYSPGSIASTWNYGLKKAGLRHRRAYETRHTFACWALSAGVNPNFIANQMGHNSAQMVYNVYGKWMTENNSDQMSIMNAGFNQNAPNMPQSQIA
ncbi:site-specific integrase [Rouxiella badensis]|uniref:site-specific integrase n=1 Tax=Rouxiella badensis TaxID=1646377 RepID=UPI001B7A01D7|nr:site-specific integrase [Rouxiella badensis]MCC3746768.1 site-specific integrase [Rouxiella badensis]